MKTLKYLSPSSISQWIENKQEFYLKYLAEDAPERFPQTIQMSIGSSFDAYVKSYLHEKLVGDNDPKYAFEALFEAQVESQNRDEAREWGDHCFKSYQKSGALGDLMKVLATGEVKFEFTSQGVIDKHRDGYKGQIGEVVFLGKPDALFTSHSINVILDWKVNGVYSEKYAKSPTPGFSVIRDGWSLFDQNASRGANSCHKEAMVQREYGWDVNIASFMNNHEESWARQLSIYSWLTGQPVGSDFICAIDQLVGKPNPNQRRKPWIRVAEHRMRIHPDFQKQLYFLAKEIWDTCSSGHIFRELDQEQSNKKQEQLDNFAKTLRGDGTDNDAWLAKVARGIPPL